MRARSSLSLTAAAAGVCLSGQKIFQLRLHSQLQFYFHLPFHVVCLTLFFFFVLLLLITPCVSLCTVPSSLPLLLLVSSCCYCCFHSALFIVCGTNLTFINCFGVATLPVRPFGSWGVLPLRLFMVAVDTVATVATTAVVVALIFQFCFRFFSSEFTH